MASRNNRNRRRAHTYKRPKAKSALQFQASHHCPVCGKWAFPSREDAEISVRQVHQGRTMHYYMCEGFWHYTSMTADQVGYIRSLTTDEPEADAC